MINVGKQDRISAPSAGLLDNFQLIVLAILLAVTLQGRADDAPLVAAASSLRSLWPALQQSYISETGQSAPRVSFGSSGLLATQIINGAPFELFLSADLASINRLPAEKLNGPAQNFALGELNLVVPQASPLTNNLTLDALAILISEAPNDNPFRLAIPNPVHAPYGIAARDALINAGIWPLAQGQLLMAENAAQTLQFVRSRAVAAALVPQALVFAHGEGVESAHLPADDYSPVEHTFVVLHKAGKSAQQFAQWLLQPSAGRVLERAGLSAYGKPMNR